MIPEAYLYEWRNHAPWAEMHQVEQDLILTRAIIELYSEPLFSDSFAFRGGTAMQKLFYNPPIRYSEDIDLVQIHSEPIGPAIDAIRKHLDPWLGTPKRDRKKNRVTLYYRFKSETAPTRPMHLKIEVNTGEHFTVLELQRKKLVARSEWFNGEAEVLTYKVEELLGTKLRALYQRKKGRDLLDLAMALDHFSDLDLGKIIKCFKHYMSHAGTRVTRAQFEANLSLKLNDDYFTADITALLATGATVFNIKKAEEKIRTALFTLLPGDPWKGPAEPKKKNRING
ncbi:nucleotidyl transferase AbiEii/AbiGii toxin family protein [Candidatus Nomurabacteria bacterium]|nr:nucleotidyl transferase AbiEii/AbiGii toxin family protein [Candidatus Nomurabacteria bacterium]